MPTTYTEETGPAKGQLEKLVRRSFPELTAAKVSITLMFAANEDGPAVKHHGVPGQAKIKINGLSDRAEGKADATLTVDADIWKAKSEREREALLAHELTHLVVKYTKSGAVKTDDLGRPKLGMITDDYTINGFYGIAEKYGDDAPEKQTLRTVCWKYRQLKLWDAWESNDSESDTVSFREKREAS